ncbi:hypothetical protein AB0K80_04280 [Streptomyces sp. NPDC052682]|uniref:hypothetical protein n=1 Tax=Streptomyces sp. NPDC052682 TaxID=3154954 RepID=UPI0034274568
MRAVIRLLIALTALCATAAATAPPARATEPAPQAAYLADRLRDNPVHVTDQLPREVPKSMAPAFAKLAQRTGVPTYVLVLPAMSALHGEELLGAVHDRLNRDGLYVLLDESTVTDATAYGVRAPAEDAADAAMYGLPVDAGPLRSFERFVEVVAQGKAEAAARAAAARENLLDEAPANLYIGPSDRENQSFVTGILLTGVPLLVLLVIRHARRYVRHRRDRLPGAEPPATTSRLARLVPPLVALATATAVAVTASLVCDQARSSASPPPTPADLSARVERVAAGLRTDPVYQDPESPRALDPRQLARLHDRIRTFARSEAGGPVYVTLVPQTPESESAGDSHLFAAAVHAKLRRDGVYVVADPDDGFIDVYTYGLRLDSDHLMFGLPDSLAYGDEKADDADDHLLGERLDALMTFLDKTPRTDRPQSVSAPAHAPDAAQEDALPPLFSGDFWPGLFVGAFLVLVLTGVLTVVRRSATALFRRRTPEPAHQLHLTAPTEPSTAYLRRTARTELRALAKNASAAHADPRASDCLDAALLLAGGAPDGVRARGLDPATLVAVIVLARAGRAALAGDPDDLYCGVNPLHGPAVARHHVRVAPKSQSRRLLPVCAPCRTAAIATPRSVPDTILKLPDPAAGNTRVPYTTLDGPLRAVPSGISRLIEKVRDGVSVH